MRLVFYPAVIGWTLLGVWITTLKIRIEPIERKKDGGMKNGKKMILVLIAIAFSIAAWSQDGNKKVEMADLMRSNGRFMLLWLS